MRKREKERMREIETGKEKVRKRLKKGDIDRERREIEMLQDDTERGQKKQMGTKKIANVYICEYHTKSKVFLKREFLFPHKDLSFDK